MIHYLWVGTLLGLLAFACKLGLRRAGASMQYVVALGWLVILAATPLAIAVWIAAQGRDGNSATSFDQRPDNVAIVEPIRPLVDFPTNEVTLRPSPEIGPSSNADVSESPFAPSNFGRREDTATSEGTRWSIDWRKGIAWLPWIWVVGAPLMLAWSIMGLAGAERLRGQSDPAAAADLQCVCQRLARTMEISRKVSVCVCRRISSPVLVGILWPAILLPPALITGLSPQQLEMLLLHELAHVRRWDNLVNLLQRVVESMLFFHPMVWLVSRWVRQQRELCCDDVVIRHIEDQDAYAETLLAAVQKSRVSRQSAVTATGTGGVVAFAARSHLALRVRRILGGEDERMKILRNLAQYLVLVLLAAFACIASFGLSWGQIQPSHLAVESPSGALGNREDRADTESPKPPRQVVLSASLIEEQDGEETDNRRTSLEITAAAPPEIYVNGRKLSDEHAVAAPKRPLQGIVMEKRNDEQVLISLGADDGLEQGHQLRVYRRVEGLELRVERLETETTAADASVCRVLDADSHDIQEGDRVATVPGLPVLISDSVQKVVDELKANPQNVLKLLDADDVAPSQDVLIALSSTIEGQEFLFRHYLDKLLATDNVNVTRRLTNLSEYEWTVLSVNSEGGLRSMHNRLETGTFGGVKGGGGGRPAGGHWRQLRRIQLLLGHVDATGLRHAQFPGLEFSFVSYGHKISIPRDFLRRHPVGSKQGGPYVCLARPLPPETGSGIPKGSF